MADKITGIVLTGGKSKRMGKEKGLCYFRGQALVAYAIQTLRPLCDEIILSANNRLDDYLKFGHHVVSDKFPDTGPIGGLFSSLLASKTDINLVISCDTPFVTTSVYKDLLSHHDLWQAIVPVHNSVNIEPLTACYHKNCLPYILNQIQNKKYKMTELLKMLNTRYVTINPVIAGTTVSLFHNLNTPEDLLSC